MTAAAGGWARHRRQGPAGTLHGEWPDGDELGHRAVAVCRPTGPALVLGSAQPEHTADPTVLAGAGTALVRRRTGGGAVLVAPGRQVWIEAWVPRRDVLWDDDVLRGGAWLGEAWAAALGDLGLAGLAVHRGRVVATAWSATVCFAGVGPGEVTAGGRKVVGLAQRRTRHGARLQSMALLDWDPAGIAALLALAPAERDRLAGDTSAVAAGLGALLARPTGAALLDAVEDAVLARLPHGEGAEQHR